jgi:hypothetical protein
VEAFGVLMKFKMALPWKLRYQNNAGGDVRYCFAMAILVIIIIIPHNFVRSPIPIFF